MPETLMETEISEATEVIESLDISHIITENDTPVDNIFSEKQQRLLAESLNSSWAPGKPFVAFANVGIFNALYEPPIVPDMFLSLDVQVAQDLSQKKNRSYFIWEFGKPPEVAIEIVSNKEGGEAKGKVDKYARIGVWYYAIFDPFQLIQRDKLRIYELAAGKYIPKLDRQLQNVGLGLTIWEGAFEGLHDQWLRWTDHEGNLIPTGLEKANEETRRADEETRRADEETRRANQEKQRADEETRRAKNAEEQARKLAEKLRSLGIDPETIISDR